MELQFVADFTYTIYALCAVRAAYAARSFADIPTSELSHVHIGNGLY